MSIIRKIFLLLCFSLFITSCSMILNFKDLPDPNGSYYIGTETFTWEDSFRDEWFTKDKIDNYFLKEVTMFLSNPLIFSNSSAIN